MRARLFRRDEARTGYTYVGELDAVDADDVWRQLEAEGPDSARRMHPGDVVFVGDLYRELDEDGGWHPLAPGQLTRGLYRQILNVSEEG